ncbi:RNA pseudouridine synthase 3, mitochondrial isoform X2 [Jatropha curcas]|uniref:RNA pseudouridine synthase 3, mitochondrial isoform X2 n=1 Tax=Jatropha curcas TaxID=180498 RepID=UPI0009D74BF3|nr:RNA pseudouridine synthase 3, mitochondrial isoform X2 [Jatropha curcas]
MWKNIHCKRVLSKVRSYSRIAAPPPAYAQPVIRVSNNVAYLGSPKDGPKPRQLLSLPPFPGLPLPGKTSVASRVTAISWVKYYFDEIPDSVIQSHFNRGLVQMECMQHGGETFMRKIKPSDVMEVGARVLIPVSVAETRISKRFDTIPSGTLYPNADEIEYLQRLVKYKGNLPVHNSMDALAAAALTYDYDEGPKLVQRLDRESSGLILMGRTKESVDHLQWMFSDQKKSNSYCKDWNDACQATCQRYWALIIGSPKEKEGLIRAPLSKVLLNDGKTERIVLAQNSGFEASQEALTEYRVLGPTINGCSWVELCPLTSRKHQLRVHCAEALGTPIVGDYKYGWFMHRRWKQMPRVDIEPFSGKPYKLRRPEGIDVQKGSVLSKVPLLHLHCRELVLPNIAKFLDVLNQKSKNIHPALSAKPDLLRFVASMPTHMKISWNLMSSYLV